MIKHSLDAPPVSYFCGQVSGVATPPRGWAHSPQRPSGLGPSRSALLSHVLSEVSGNLEGEPFPPVLGTKPRDICELHLWGGGAGNHWQNSGSKMAPSPVITHLVTLTLPVSPSLRLILGATGNCLQSHRRFLSLRSPGPGLDGTRGGSAERDGGAHLVGGQQWGPLSPGATAWLT